MGGLDTVVGNGVVVMGRMVGKLPNVMLHDRLDPYSKVQVYQNTILSTQINLKYI